MAQVSLFEDQTGAEFSPCEKYRYRLWRRWGEQRDCMFLMLNPSTADEQSNDPTVERCQRYALRWGYGGLVVCNLFAIRATDPKVMLKDDEPIGPGNNEAILDEAGKAGIVVCAWGNDGQHMNRSSSVAEMLTSQGISLNALKQNKNGEPAHPLYLRADLTPSKWP